MKQAVLQQSIQKVEVLSHAYDVSTCQKKQMGGVGRDKRGGRARSGSIVSTASMASMVSTPGFGAAGVGVGVGVGDPHRETELSVATDNLSIEEIDGNVFRMSKDQVRSIPTINKFSAFSLDGRVCANVAVVCLSLSLVNRYF